MASLLSWASGAVKRVGNTIHNDVIAPIQRDVVQPAQAAVAQANPLDNGRTAVTVMTHGAQYAPQRPASVVHQVTHNGASNFVGNNFVKPILATPLELGNQGYNHIIAPTLGLPHQTVQNTFGKKLTNFTGATDSPLKAAGDTAQTALTIGTAGLGPVVERGLGSAAARVGIKALPKVVSKPLTGAVTGGLVGGPYNVAGNVSAGQPITKQNVVKNLKQGAEFGAALGAGGEALGLAAPVVKNAVVKGAKAATKEPPAVLELRAQKAANIKAMDTAKPGMMKNLVANVNSLDSQIKAIKEGGYAKVPGGSLDPAPNLHPEQKTFINDYAEMLQSMEGGQGGLMQNTADGGKIRTTANSPFYSKVFAETGKPPTKAAYFDEARRQIESGKAAFGASEDYKGLPALNKTPAPQVVKTASKGIILKETKPRGGRQDVIVARHNPETGHLQASQESIQAPPKFLQPEGVGAKPTLKPNIELDTSVQHTLKNGTSEDAIQTVMDTTGADLQSAAKYVSRVAQQSKIDLGIQDSTKNPKLGSVSVPAVKQGDLAQPVLNAKFVQEHEHRVGQQALDSYGKLTAHDQVLLKQIETGTVSKVAEEANNPAAFKQAEQSIRNYYDTRHAYDRYLGIDVGYRTNYLRQIFNKVEQNTGNDQISLKGSNKRPGYTHERTNETLGADVRDALQKDIDGASFNHAKLAYEQGINEATGGKVAKGELVRTPQDGAYQQIQNKYGQDLSVPKDIAQQINSRTWDQAGSKALQRYDSVNHMLKYVKLSGGLFHAFTEGGNFVGQQIVSGKLVTNPTATGKMFKIFFSPKAMDGEMNRLAQTGKLDQMHFAGLQLRPKDIKADINVSSLDKGTSKIAKYTLVQSMHNATFQREIPYAKAKIFEQKTQGLDVNNPADLAKMRETARGINNLFGGINREVNGIKPNTFQWLQRGLLATDFTEGKLHTLWDAATHGGPAGKLAREAVVGKALLFAVLATAGAAAGGEFQGQNGKQIAKNAAGNLLDPSFEMGGYKVGFPKTHVSELIGAVKPTTHTTGAPWNASGLVTYAQDRAAALPSEAIQLLSNKNYYGQPLYGKNTKKNGGGPISAPQTAMNVAQTVLPIPFGQVTNTATGKQNAGAAAANIVGFKAKPNPANSVTLQGVNTTLTDPQRRDYTSVLSNTKKSITTQLTSSPAYNALTPNQQAQAMTNLNGYITTTVNKQIASKYGLGQFSQGFTGKQTQASAKEQQIASGKINPTDFFPGNASSATTAKKAKTAKAPKAPKTPKVAKTKSTTGRRRTTGTGGRTAKAKTVSLASYLSTVKSANSHSIKTPKAPSFKVASASGPKFKTVSLKQYRLQKSKIA